MSRARTNSKGARNGGSGDDNEEDTSLFNTCSRTEKQMLLVAFVILMYHFNVFSFFHSQTASEAGLEEKSFLGVAPSAVGMVDTEGQNWVPTTERDTLRCINIDGLIKSRGDVRDDEKALFKDLGCEERMKELYSNWEKDSTKYKAKCNDLKDKYGIEVGLDWGVATLQVKKAWKNWRCDCHFPAGWSQSCLNGLPPTVHQTTTPAGIQAAAEARNASERVVSSSDPKLPIIAITLGTTSRGYRWESLDDSPLIKIFLSSLVRTLDKGFEYRIYAGFDVGDLFYDDEAKQKEIHKWFQKHVAQKAEEKGISITLRLMRFLNVLRKPGPIFNYLAASAFMDGADYTYRINDDTEFRTAWAAAFVDSLSKFDPPNLGVVGPTCFDGNMKILTHDFVHRTHSNIFQTYYPVVLSDWWMDDWISKVYPRRSTLRHPSVAVSHHIWMTGGGDPVRYTVDHSHKHFLQDELEHGIEIIGLFKQKHCKHNDCVLPDGHTTKPWKGTYNEENQSVFDSIIPTDSPPAWDDSYGSNFGNASLSSPASAKAPVPYKEDDEEMSAGNLDSGDGGPKDEGSDWEADFQPEKEANDDYDANDRWDLDGPEEGDGGDKSKDSKKRSSADVDARSRDEDKGELGSLHKPSKGTNRRSEKKEEAKTESLKKKISKLQELAKKQSHNIFVPRSRTNDQHETNTKPEKEDEMLAKIGKMEKEIETLREEYDVRVKARMSKRQKDVSKVLQNENSGPLTSSQLDRATVVPRKAKMLRRSAGGQASSAKKSQLLLQQAASGKLDVHSFFPSNAPSDSGDYMAESGVQRYGRGEHSGKQRKRLPSRDDDEAGMDGSDNHRPDDSPKLESSQYSKLEPNEEDDVDDAAEERPSSRSKSGSSRHSKLDYSYDAESGIRSVGDEEMRASIASSNRKRKSGGKTRGKAKLQDDNEDDDDGGDDNWGDDDNGDDDIEGNGNNSEDNDNGWGR